MPTLLLWTPLAGDSLQFVTPAGPVVLVIPANATALQLTRVANEGIGASTTVLVEEFGKTP